MKLFARTRVQTLGWSVVQAGEQWAFSSEDYLSFLAVDGHVHQETQDPPLTRFPLPPAFSRHHALWKRFLAQYGCDAFHLRLAGRSSRYCGPPGRLRHDPLCWTLHLGFTTSALGRRTLSWTVYGAEPPSRALMAWAKALSRIRRFARQPYRNEQIILPGHVLLDALGTATEELLRRTTGDGRWIVSNNPRPHEDQSGTMMRFLPDSVGSPPPHAPRALLYDSEEQSLICRAPDGSGVGFQLGQPLYRFLSRLAYGKSPATMVIKDIYYQMPLAWIRGD